MKKLVSCLLSATLSAAVLLSFAGCQWDAGGSNFTPSDEWIAAAAAYNAKVAEIEDAKNSAVKDEEGNIIEDVYTRSSIAAFTEEINALNLPKKATGKTAEELYALIDEIDGVFETLETADEAVDKRLAAAIKALKLYVCYGDTSTDAYGQTIIPYPATEKNPQGTIVYVKEEDGDTVPCDKDDEGAHPIANNGVDRIDYDPETNHATFVLSQHALELYLISFTQTNVLIIFDRDFGDLSKIQFDFTVNENGEDVEKSVVMRREETSGMYLAAGLLAMCAGGEFTNAFSQFASDGNLVYFNSILSGIKQQKYDLVAGKGCSASVTFSNSDYVKTLTFSVAFTNP